MKLESICLLGLGEVGSTLAADLLANTSLSLRVWDWQLDKTDSAAAGYFHQFAGNERVTRARNAADAAAQCQLVLSAVTADQACAAAQSILPGLCPGTWYIDVNSVSPATKKQLGALMDKAEGRFVEASIMSPIHPARSGAPILLAGPHAHAFAELGRTLGFSNAQVVSETLGTAAATKMCRSVIVKGVEALVTESLLSAHFYGVESEVLESLNNLFPRSDWPQFARYLISRSLQHGERRAAEMREVAQTVREAGVTPWMSDACAQRQDWAAQYGHLLSNQNLEQLLDVLGEALNTASKPHTKTTIKTH